MSRGERRVRPSLEGGRGRRVRSESGMGSGREERLTLCVFLEELLFAVLEGSSND